MHVWIPASSSVQYPFCSFFLVGSLLVLRGVEVLTLYVCESFIAITCTSSSSFIMPNCPKLKRHTMDEGITMQNGPFCNLLLFALDGLNSFAYGAVSTVRTVNLYIDETNLSTVHSKVVNDFVREPPFPTWSLWRSTFSAFDEANSFVLRGYARLVENSQYGSYLFQVTYSDDEYRYMDLLQLNVNESQLSQTYRYAFLSGDFY